MGDNNSYDNSKFNGISICVPNGNTGKRVNKTTFINKNGIRNTCTIIEHNVKIVVSTD